MCRSISTTHSKGVHLTRFVDLNRVGLFPGFGDVFVTSAVGKSVYNGFTVGMRKRLQRAISVRVELRARERQGRRLERARSVHRTPSFNPLDLKLDYALSDRDIRHKFNFFTYIDMGWGSEGNFRVQGRTAQPITPGQSDGDEPQHRAQEQRILFV